MDKGGMNEEGDVRVSREGELEGRKESREYGYRERERRADENRGRVIILSTSSPCGLIQ